MQTAYCDRLKKINGSLLGQKAGRRVWATKLLPCRSLRRGKRRQRLIITSVRPVYTNIFSIYLSTGADSMVFLRTAQDQSSRRGAIEQTFFQSRTLVITDEITHPFA